ncbi:Ribbon-helix-helix [Nostoc flagelliforme CCNUN1]|uniref:Ribbon-helix-helix n=1 Tax=Nostoc flagelliforme CCNUN1 TaxID=2038116 RepID=A0A2K8T2W0_9NOSO|nr:hypothetical protein [Nostoc flagelliforme]AUB42011.1 Ribbon-helix-helix [Nostoc flagelliforme CCNUN1]
MSQVQKNNDSERGQINFRYPPDKIKKLKERAQQEGIKMSALLSKLCDDYLGEKPKELPESQEILYRIEQKLVDIEGKLAA